MDPNRASADQQKDFLSFLFTADSFPDAQRTDHHQIDLLSSSSSGQPPRTPSSMANFSAAAGMSGLNSMDIMNSMNSLLQGIDPAQQSQQGQSSNMGMNMFGQNQLTPQMLLEKQYKLTQLHQLQQLQSQIQNQIFQQQLALISGQASVLNQNESSTDAYPTPVSSTELRPTPNHEFMPRVQQQQQQQQQHFGTMPSMQQHQKDIFAPQSTMDPSALQSPHIPPSGSFHPNHHSHAHSHHLHPGSASAPANLVFNTLPSPSDIELDLSPITSPWLPAYQQHVPSTSSGSASASGSGAGAGSSGSSVTRAGNKRTASPSGENAATARKRMSPSVSTFPKKHHLPRAAKSATNTPLMHATGRSRRNSSAMTAAMDMPGAADSPSPVDLAMPPPASRTRSSRTPPGGGGVNPGGGGNREGGDLQAQVDVARSAMTPVTPASIMNLGRLGISSSLTAGGPADAGSGNKGKEGSRAKEGASAAASTSTSTSISKGGSSKKGSLPLISPGPKPILPAGGTPAPLTLTPSPLTLPRKSHKDAEQKRRDSLKHAYDDLRILLPPLPLPSEDGGGVGSGAFGDAAPLPGALPPRGPPKAGGDGPNRAVSKLQLLRCGNEYIRLLKGRVERRDVEVERLRREVRRLRVGAGAEGGEEGMDGMDGEEEEEVDLERDLDAEEAGMGLFGSGVRRGDTIEEDVEEEGE
ncbi:hypothetical protein CONPUDRAFT_145615 [Coniophora puteana RWD-64-598 SS2]|uniref:BHLH domain-containing protein n=1 Tax=Coniophora puteana (strain RWD-64-598) TaxID=741705 RepID=A0A5M3MGK4_CONPW|nr:uncharacterized protein CONPUDRAFT_145615 [Coniophora puteana RWD-64-598 SS2]EIW78352.1 hypothetical protein CONPUDRAFT_145615 [Coniophora puteana RWD-64-598 SS2]